MTVPYSFGTATSAIPLSQLDSNFNTPITLGNTAIQLGNTVTTLNNMTLANVTISSGSVTLTNVSVTTANVATANIATSIITTSETLSYGTANGVAYLNGSKVVTTGSALTFDGSTQSVTGKFSSSNAGNENYLLSDGSTRTSLQHAGNSLYFNVNDNSATSGQFIWRNTNSFTEQMRLTSTGLGIGTSSPGYKLTVNAFTGVAGPIGAFKQSAETSAFYGLAVQRSGNDSTLGMAFNSSADAWQISASYASSGAYKPIQLLTSDTVRVTLDSSGNLGLGVTPSTWLSTRKALQLPDSGYFATAGATLFVTANAYIDSGSTTRYVADGYATRYRQTSGQHEWFNAASGTAGNPITFTQAMTLDSGGSLGIGTTSPSSIIHAQKASGSATYLQLAQTGVESWQIGMAASSSALAFLNSATERARIDSSGNLLVGTTAQQTGGNGKLSVSGGSSTAATLTNNSNASAYTAEVFNYTTGTGAGVGRYFKFAMGSTPTQTGSIIGDGTNTAYNTSSDYRLKENITPMTGALALVMQQRPVTWTWKLNGNQGKGFIAHWLQEDGAGECVTGHKDAVDENGNPEYQGVDTSFLVATLTAAIQELKAEFDAYKATHP